MNESEEEAEIIHVEERRKSLYQLCRYGRTPFQEFNFAGRILKDDDIHIITSFNIPPMEVLDFHGNDFSSKSVREIWKLGINVIEADLSNNPIEDEGISQFPSKLEDLLRLKLRENGITHLGVSHLVKLEMRNLCEIMLNQNSFGNKGCRLLTLADWPFLTSIFLSNNDISDAGAIHLSKANWKNMITLYLMDNDLTQLGVSHLRRGDWKCLKTLSIHSDKFDCWFRLIEFHPNNFTESCIFSYRRLKPKMIMTVNNRYEGYLARE